ncbi:MAG: ATP-binding cassette domain-containing protein [Eubacteriales bacterium]|nr:ATP-binding cassette domain-containing protein [Eubacteriales bacterium]
MERELLRASGVVSESAGRRRLDGVSLLLAEGQMLGIIGRSGAGKTQLAQVLAGEIAPDAGMVLLREKRAPLGVLRREGGRIARTSRLIGNLTVAENLLSVCLKGHWIWKKRRMRALCAEILEEYGLTGYAQAQPAQLPSHVQHRILLVHAVLCEKKFVILESEGDRLPVKEQAALLHTIRAVSRRGVAVLYLSRRMDAVQQGMQKNVVMADGRIVKILSPNTREQAAMNTYLYGYSGANFPWDTRSGGGKKVFDLPGLPVCLGELCVVRDADGSADALVRLICSRCAAAGLPAPGVLDNEALDGALLNQISVLDNILLTAASKSVGFGWRLSRKMQRLIRAECSEQTGLTDAQLLLRPKQLSRAEQLRLLLYRFSLLGARICVIDRPGADRADFVALQIAANHLLKTGCTVFYIVNTTDELLGRADRLYVWKNGELKEDI